MINKRLTRTAYAKINLALAILGRRPDGYHVLESVMQTVSLHDDVEISLEGTGLVCQCGDLSGPRNLAYQAAESFQKRLGYADGVTIRIVKRIPVQAGLAGGSSDAAAVLNGLNQLYGTPCTMSQLREMSVALGSDVAFFLQGGTAWISGSGEGYDRLPDAPPLDVVIVQPDRGVHTGQAYRVFDQVSGGRQALDALAWQQALRTQDSKRIAELLSNDLEAASIRLVPQIAGIKQDLLEAGCLGSLMSGSGSAVFGIAPSSAAAEVLSKEMTRKGYRAWQATTVQ
ncbi:MAG: 4-(cytidine 5'-diphospho)-2-C-methyl-D-erythritol kinase [Peptococcaceae bacterium]|nr:4-(cytidine 5'-diphospho)-2-C-methyl-D-erythritol kinase [Peptococcaceae bacterium]